MGTLLGMVLVIGVFYVAIDLYRGWMRLVALIVQVAFLVLVAHAYRRLRYPGLYIDRRASATLREIYYSFVLVFVGLPLAVLLGLVFLSHVVPIDRWTRASGLRFSLDHFQRVVVADWAPPEWRPGGTGVIRGVRVLQQAELSNGHVIPAGTVLYAVEFEDGEMDIPGWQLLPSA